MNLRAPTLALILTNLAVCAQAGATDGPTGWLDWRGPSQSGVSVEKGLPEAADAGGARWTFAMPGRGTPVVSGGRLYTMAYSGEGLDLTEAIVCLDAATGELVWKDTWNDFLTDVVYDRYAIGSPTIDPETGNVFVLATSGVLRGYTAGGELLWDVSMMEEFGRLTFPNGRTGAPLLDGDRVVIHIINSHWGPVEGPARDRFYAFDKRTGEVLWVCTPALNPVDSSFSHPVLEDRGGRRVLYSGTGCGHLVALDARTGDALWRFQMSNGGVNSSPVIHGDTIIEIDGRENLDSSALGRMIALPLGVLPGGEPFSIRRSPALDGDRFSPPEAPVEMCMVVGFTGAVLWHHKLAPDQIHASPAYGDGKLYVPMTNGSFWVLRATDEGPEVLSTTQLDGSCLGAPAICGGRVYVHTTEKLYCFGEVAPEPAWPVRDDGTPGKAVRLRVVPADANLTVGERVAFKLQTLDAAGRVVDPDVEIGGFELKMAPALAEDGAAMKAVRPGVCQAVFQAEGMSATARVRVVASLPWKEDFEGYALEKPGSDGTLSAAPPSAWIGVNRKWEVVELAGQKVLRKALDTPLFQRAMGFCGDERMSNYTVTADLMTDGNRRTLSSPGVVNQRYLIQLFGNFRVLQISSNDERLKAQAPFPIQPGVWYRLKTRVDVAEDGSGVVRAKAWQRDEEEPEAWTLEVHHDRANAHGAPGIFAFTPLSRFHVYVDNFEVTPND